MSLRLSQLVSRKRGSSALVLLRLMLLRHLRRNLPAVTAQGSQNQNLAPKESTQTMQGNRNAAASILTSWDLGPSLANLHQLGVCSSITPESSQPEEICHPSQFRPPAKHRQLFAGQTRDPPKEKKNFTEHPKYCRQTSISNSVVVHAAVGFPRGDIQDIIMWHAETTPATDLFRRAGTAPVRTATARTVTARTVPAHRAAHRALAGRSWRQS